MTALEKAKKIIESLSTKKIIEQFELTEKMDSMEVYTVRGWYMDELEKRDATAFDKWMDSLEDSPRKFYL